MIFLKKCSFNNVDVCHIKHRLDLNQKDINLRLETASCIITVIIIIHNSIEQKCNILK